MNKNLENRILEITRKLKDEPKGKNKHFTFIVRRSRILSVGFNDYWCSHTMANKLGYRFNGIHSELSAYLKFREDKEKLSKCTLVNTRINSKGEIGYSKPCELCEKLIDKMGIKKVYFTNRNGEMERFI